MSDQKAKTNRHVFFSLNYTCMNTQVHTLCTHGCTRTHIQCTQTPHTYAHTPTPTPVHVYAHTYTRTHTEIPHMYAHTHSHIRTCLHTHTHAHTRTHSHIHTRLCTHTHAHTHMHAHTCTCLHHHMHKHTLSISSFPYCAPSWASVTNPQPVTHLPQGPPHPESHKNSLFLKARAKWPSKYPQCLQCCYLSLNLLYQKQVHKKNGESHTGLQLSTNFLLYNTLRMKSAVRSHACFARSIINSAGEMGPLMYHIQLLIKPLYIHTYICI